ncbi:MAG: DUF4281 domain-containing protein [Cytophagales bacterium]|nr:MAG: DUF4281 domain-containing protein [Cytophagales bacterium]
MMSTVEIIFNIFNTAVLPVWFLMIFLPKQKFTHWLTRTQVVPFAIAIAYACIIFSVIGSLQNADFSSLAGIKALFSAGNDWTVTAAWFHYLAFDLLVGIWIFHHSQEAKIPHLYIVPCLIFTFLLGPVGFLMYKLLGLFTRKKLD